MRYITHNDNEINFDDTSLQGKVEIGYSSLCSLFGQPHGSDGHKCDAGWDIEFEDGTVVTIYNWKNGKNYLGSEGYDTQKITSWNVGGKDGDAFSRIKRVIENAQKLATAQGHWPAGYESFAVEEAGYTWNLNN